MWEGPWFSASSENDPGMPCVERGRISLQRFNAGSSFISQDERMSESTVKTLQKALGVHIISTSGLISLWHIKRHAEFSASKADDTWLFLNIVRNPNITVPTRKWPSVSHLTYRSVRIVLQSLVCISELSIITRLESWLPWKNTNFECPSPP